MLQIVIVMTYAASPCIRAEGQPLSLSHNSAFGIILSQQTGATLNSTFSNRYASLSPWDAALHWQLGALLACHCCSLRVSKGSRSTLEMSEAGGCITYVLVQDCQLNLSIITWHITHLT